MENRMMFQDREEFLSALRDLAREGVPQDRIRVETPYYVHEVDEILPPKPAKVKNFALLGAASGTSFGFAFTILTSLSWPLVVGGKPIVSIPPFIIIAFALTILFGALSTFFGFLVLARLPSVFGVVPKEEFGNAFVITVEPGETK
jgi:Alternative complex III, ActD subunit